MSKKFNSIVVIHKSKLMIKERRTLRGTEETEEARMELVEKYKDEDDAVRKKVDAKNQLEGYCF